MEEAMSSAWIPDRDHVRVLQDRIAQCLEQATSDGSALLTAYQALGELRFRGIADPLQSISTERKEVLSTSTDQTWGHPAPETG